MREKRENLDRHPYSSRSFPRGTECPRGFIRKVTYLEVISNASFSTGVPPLFVEKYYGSISLSLSLSFSLSLDRVRRKA